MALTAAQLMVRVGADTSEAEAGLNKVGRSITSMAGSMAGTLGKVSAGLTLGVTTPLVALGTQALSSAADFERSMNVLAAVTSAPADAMAALQEQALQLGAETSFSAGEAAAAMLELGKAGMDTAAIGDAIAGVMDLAAAGNIELAEAASITSAALSTFGLHASEADYVANSLAATANASAADIADLSYGIKNAGAVMAANGVEIDELNTLMGLLTNHGLEASDAATSLKTMHMRLTAPTAKAAKVMKTLGINVFDATGHFRDYREIVDDMTVATKDMSDEQRSAAFTTVFGADAIRAANIVVQEGVRGYDEMFAAVKQQDMATVAAAANMSGLSGAFEYLTGSIDSFLIGAAQPFLEFAADIARGVADAITWIGALPDPIKNAALAFAAVLAAAGPLVGVIAGVAGAIALLGSAAAPILLVTAAVAGLAAMITGLSTAGIIDLATPWNTVKNAVQSAIDTVLAWRDQISTQGLISEETFIATWELPPAAREFMQFVIGLGAAFKTLSAAVTGTDLGAGRLRELTTILESAFGAEIATRIQNIATHITTLKEALSGATSVGEWLSSLGDFGKNVGGEIKGIAVEIKKQIEAQLIELKIGETLIGLIQVQIDKIPWPSLQFDLATVLETIQTEFTTFQSDVKTAWETGGWAGLGELAKSKITALGDSINQALGSMVQRMQVQLFFGVLALDAATQSVVSQIGVLIQSIRDALTPEAPTTEPEPPTALQTGMQQWRDQVLADMTTAVETFDFTKTATTILVKLSASLATGDYTGMGVAINTGIKKAFTSGAVTASIATVGAALAGVLMPGLGDSIRNITWTVSSGNFAGFKTAVINAFTNIDWSAINLAALTFRGVVNAAFGKAFGGLLTGGELKTPQWISDLLAWQPSTPAWIQSMLDWSPTTPEWIQSLLDWSPTTPGWVESLLGWQKPEPELPKIGAPGLGRGRIAPGDPFGPFGVPRISPGTEFDFPLKATITEAKADAALQPFHTEAIITKLTKSATLAPLAVEAAEAGAETAGKLGSTLSGFAWPDLPDWTWPPYNPFKWSPYPPWQWPPIPAPSWLNRMVVPRPTWLGELLSWSPQVVLRQQAVTTPGQIASVAAAGEGMVGAAAMGSGGVTITGDVYVRDELDLEQLAMRITQIQNRRS